MRGKQDQKRKPPERLTSAIDFARIFGQGSRVRGGEVNLLYLARGDAAVSRWGIAVSRKYGTAVRRNRVRRVARAVVGKKDGAFRGGFDLVLEFLLAAKELSRKELRSRVEALLLKAPDSLAGKRVNVKNI